MKKLAGQGLVVLDGVVATTFLYGLFILSYSYLYPELATYQLRIQGSGTKQMQAGLKQGQSGTKCGSRIIKTGKIRKKQGQAWAKKEQAKTSMNKKDISKRYPDYFIFVPVLSLLSIIFLFLIFAFLSLMVPIFSPDCTYFFPFWFPSMPPIPPARGQHDVVSPSILCWLRFFHHPFLSSKMSAFSFLMLFLVMVSSLPLSPSRLAVFSGPRHNPI